MSEDVDSGRLHRLVRPRRGTFIVSRTSDYSGQEKPCDDAYRAEAMLVDRRIKGYDPTKTNDWLQRGTNHRIEDGQYCRDMGWDKVWAIDIPDVMEFVAKHGPCVVSVNREGFHDIEIYDGYRE
jgi:hypothetical protein